LYQGRKIKKLLDFEEESKFVKALENFILYYAFAVEKYRNTKEEHFATHPRQVLSEDNELSSNFLNQINFTQPNEDTINYLSNDYDLLLRGKTLFELLILFLSHSKRTTKHNKKSLLESCFKLHPNDAIKELINNITDKL